MFKKYYYLSPVCKLESLQTSANKTVWPGGMRRYSIWLEWRLNTRVRATHFPLYHDFYLAVPLIWRWYRHQTLSYARLNWSNLLTPCCGVNRLVLIAPPPPTGRGLRRWENTPPPNTTSSLVTSTCCWGSYAMSRKFRMKNGWSDFDEILYGVIFWLITRDFVFLFF